MQVIKGRVSCSCADHIVMLHGTLVVWSQPLLWGPHLGYSIGELV